MKAKSPRKWDKISEITALVDDLHALRNKVRSLMLACDDAALAERLEALYVRLDPEPFDEACGFGEVRNAGFPTPEDIGFAVAEEVDMSTPDMAAIDDILRGYLQPRPTLADSTTVVARAALRRARGLSRLQVKIRDVIRARNVKVSEIYVLAGAGRTDIKNALEDLYDRDCVTFFT